MSQQNHSLIKVLIVVNDVTSILKFAPALRQRGYIIEVVLNAKAAIDNIKAIKPDVMLLSWDLHCASIARTYAIFKDEFNVPCLVFSEVQSKRSISMLMRNRILHTLYHPLSGDGIDRQIQLLLREKNQSKNTGKNSEEYGADYYYNEPKRLQPVDSSFDKNDDSEEENFVLNPGDKTEFRSLLARCVKDVIRANFNSPNQMADKINMVSSLYAMSIPSKHFRGYLIAAQADDKMNSNFISQFYYKLQRRMRRLGDPLHENENVIPIHVQPINFIESAEKFSDFIIKDSLNDKEVAFAYMPLSSLPEVDWLEKDGFLSVNFKDWLQAGSKLLFDLFIHMPVNKKYILFLKKDTEVSQEVLNKFLRLGVKNIFIKPTEKDLFLSYCIQMKINESMSKSQNVA